MNNVPLRVWLAKAGIIAIVTLWGVAIVFAFGLLVVPAVIVTFESMRFTYLTNQMFRELVNGFAIALLIAVSTVTTSFAFIELRAVAYPRKQKDGDSDEA